MHNYERNKEKYLQMYDMVQGMFAPPAWISLLVKGSKSSLTHAVLVAKCHLATALGGAATGYVGA